MSAQRHRGFDPKPPSNPFRGTSQFTMAQRIRLRELMKSAKTGQRLPPEDQAYLEDAFAAHPEEYRELHMEVQRWALEYVTGRTR